MTNYFLLRLTSHKRNTFKTRLEIPAKKKMVDFKREKGTVIK